MKLVVVLSLVSLSFAVPTVDSAPAHATQRNKEAIRFLSNFNSFMHNSVTARNKLLRQFEIQSKDASISHSSAARDTHKDTKHGATSHSAPADLRYKLVDALRAFTSRRELPSAHDSEQRQSLRQKYTGAAILLESLETSAVEHNSFSEGPNQAPLPLVQGLGPILQTRQSVVRQSGLTLDPCTNDADCKGERQCIDRSGPASCSSSSTDCVCLPSDPIECTTATKCPKGEVCATFDDGNRVCVSKEQIPEALPSPQFIIEPTSPPTSTTSPPPGTGLTLDPCKKEKDCQDGRRCISRGGKENCSASDADCICIPLDPIKCEKRKDCPDGEVCGLFDDGQKLCVSKEQVPSSLPSLEPSPEEPNEPSPSPGASTDTSTPTPTPASTDDPVCIDARALSHLSPEELVFEKHAVATVLCDKNESCATPGHIVAYKGNAMMMSTYCAVVGCTKQRMLVNSPSYRRGMRVASNTRNLDFTAFAARYNTRAEEIFLTAAVHIGL